MRQQSILGTDKIILSKSFNRSTNLELDFSDTKRVGDIYLTAKFLSGMNDILDSILVTNSNQRVRVLSGSPGLGKSTFALLMANLVSKKVPRVIKGKLSEDNSTLSKDVSAKLDEFQKSKRTKLVPVFLNGYCGEIEDAFIEKLKLALEREGLGKDFDKLTSASSKKYAEVLKKWEKGYPELLAKYKAILADKSLDVVEFEKSLKKGKVSASKAFEEIHLTLTGVSAQTGANSGALEIYKGALELLSSNGFAGIFVIYDEFGKYLERGIHNPSSLNIQFLQDFAEFCDRSGETQCHLNLITHLSVSQYASQLPITVQKEWAKIEGRFQESAFYDRGTGSYEMITHVFEQGIDQTDAGLYKKVKKTNEGLLSNVQGKGLELFFERKNPAELLSKCYPLHPISLALLPVISQKVAQNERTLYTFLTRDEENSLAQFLATSNLDENSYLCVSDLYQYFAPLIAKDVGIGGTYKINLMVEEAFGKISKDDKIGRELLSYIALSSIAKNYIQFPLSKDFLIAAFENMFSKKEIEAKLTELQSMKFVYFNKILKQYELQQGSSIDVDEEIEKFRSIKLTSKDLVRIVKDYFPQDFIVPKRYNFNFSITRFAPTAFISVEELKGLKFKTSPDYNREDALLYYVIPFDQEELLQARKLVSEMKSTLVVFVLPESFIECRRDIEELNAVNALFNNKEVIQSGPLVKKELERHKSVTLHAIKSTLDKLIGKFRLSVDVYYSKLDLKKHVLSYSDLSNTIGTILEQEYSGYVAINSELINKQKASGTISLARRQLIDGILSKSLEENLGLKGNGPEVSILKSLVAISKFKIKEDSVLISKSSDLHKLFENYKSWMINAENGVEATELYDRLMAPPFGLRKCVIPLYLALFDQLLDYPVSHYYLNEYLPKVDGEHYEMMFKHPKVCRVKYTQISKARASYLNQLSNLFGAENKNATVAIALESVFKWRSSIPPYTKEVTTLKGDYKKVLIALDSAIEPEKLLFERIPDAFGFEAVDEKTKDSVIVKLLEKIKDCKTELPKVYIEQIQSIHGSLIETLNFIQETCLGEEPLKYVKGMNLAELFQKTLNRFPKEIENYPFNKLTSDFLSRIRSFDCSKHGQYFVETMGDVLTKSNPRNWSEKGKSLFDANLLRCRTEIEMVFELMSPNFNGRSVIAFINRQSGEKEYMQLGVVSDLKESLQQARSKVESIVSDLSHNERNALLMSLLIKESEQGKNIEIKGLQGRFIK